MRRSMTSIGLGSLVTVLATGCAFPVYAQTCSATISSISYGSSVDVLPGAAVDTTGTLTVSCTGTAGRSVRICANLGRRNPNAPGGDPYRLMQGNATGTQIRHELYSDSGRSSRWGSWDNPGYASGGVQFDVPLGTSGSGVVSQTIYARLLASQQTAQPDTYVMTLSGNTHSYSYQYVNTSNASLPACPYTPWVRYADTVVTATIPPLCYLTVNGINFGAHSTSFSSDIAATGSIAPQCSNTQSYTVSLGGGLSGATNPTQRKMSNGSLQVTYGLYRDNAHALPWGSTVGVDTVAGTGTGSQQSITVYGRLPVQAVPGSGTYSDSVVVTLTY